MTRDAGSSIIIDESLLQILMALSFLCTCEFVGIQHQLITVALCIAKGLEELHGEQIIHRDLSLRNVMVVPEGGAEWNGNMGSICDLSCVKIIDLGVAHIKHATPTVTFLAVPMEVNVLAPSWCKMPVATVGLCSALPSWCTVVVVVCRCVLTWLPCVSYATLRDRSL